MNFTNETLLKMKEKLKTTKENSLYFYKLGNELKLKKYTNIGDNMNSCLDLWIWDKYEKNKILDLKSVNRCKNKFCPNCRSFSTAIALHNFEPVYKQMLIEGYTPYLLTLTVPNVSGDELDSTLNKMMLKYKKFWEWFNKPLDKGRKGYKNRFFDMVGAVRAIEVTIQKNDNNMYHPHYHLIVFVDNHNECDFKRYISGPYRRNSNSFIKFSDSDIQIMKLWYMAWNDISISQYPVVSENWFDLYMCDIREMDRKGLYEVFKYSFKDTDIKDYNSFKTLYFALYKRRLRQGFGSCYNVQFEDDTGEKQELPLEFEEAPEELIIKKIDSLLTTYVDFKKISRFKAYNHLDNVE